MIFYYFLKSLTAIGIMFGTFLPKIDTLPWGIDGYLQQGVQGYRMLALYFPPFQTVLDAFLIYIGFKILMQILKAIPFFGKIIR